MKMHSPSQLIQFTNCRILRDHQIIREDFWVRNGKIINPEKIFFDEKSKADIKIDCRNGIIAPGFIDLQINGGFGKDFSFNIDLIEEGVNTVAKGLLAHGVGILFSFLLNSVVTSFCPTLVTSPNNVYRRVLPHIRKRAGGIHGATILGVHVEGPFINVEKKGAHPSQYIQGFTEGIKTVLDTYNTTENIKIVTLAPELVNSLPVIQELSKKNIVVSVGHSMADLIDGERAVHHGATFITHLFNAMLPFHHRDPGLVGLLTSDNIPSGKTVYFGIIADGIHTHPSALRIAHRAHPKGLVLVTDAISAMGLEEGTHHIGQFAMEVRNGKAFIAGTNTLCGSIATMNECVQIFRKATACSMEYALEAASLHPAQVLGISDSKGVLSFGADADFIIFNDVLDVLSTWIAGECVYKKKL